MNTTNESNPCCCAPTSEPEEMTAEAPACSCDDCDCPPGQCPCCE